MARPPLVLNESGRRYIATRPITAQEILAQAQTIIRSRIERRPEISSCDVAVRYLKFLMAGLDREVIGALLLDNKHRLLNFAEISSGTVNTCSVHVREILRSALRVNASAMILTHNHPSGDPTPSQADRMLTKHIWQAMVMVDVQLVDHVIIGGDDFFSFAMANEEPWGETKMWQPKKEARCGKKARKNMARGNK